MSCCREKILGNCFPTCKKQPTKVAGHPSANEFADMLEQLFAGDPGRELQQPQLTETAWENSDVYKAIKRMKLQKSADKRALVAESLLKYAPDFVTEKVVDNFTDLITTGDVPRQWHKTVFKMLPKKQSFKSSLGLSAHCKHSIILQTFRVHDTRTNRGTIGIHPA